MDNLLLAEEVLRVGVLGPIDWIRNLQHEINRRAIKKVDLFQVRATEMASKIDALIYYVEHAEQIPTQQLKSFPEMPKIAVLETPLPLHYVQLSQSGWWRFVAWQDGRFDKVADVLMEMKKKPAKTNDNPLVNQLRSWVQENGEYPTRLVWTNAPSQWSGKKEFILSSAPAVLGSLDSSADIKFPLTGRGEWAVLQKTKFGLQFRSLIPKLAVEFGGDPSQLKVGDRIKIFDYQLEFAQSNEWTQLKTLLKKHGALDVPASIEKNRTLAETLRELMESGMSGELGVRSEAKNGFIVVQEGYIEEALTGPVSGIKALFRILSWSNVESRFERFLRPQTFSSSIRLGTLEFQNAYDRWKQKLNELKALWPPHQLRISPDPAAYMKKNGWKPRDFMVFSVVCESQRVYEVVNQCALLDIDVIETLITLRRDNLIRIA